MPKRAATILLVDDEETDRTSLCQWLQKSGHVVVPAESYQAALSAFALNAKRVRLLIADISLPDGNGCELAMALRDLDPKLRVLFVSGHVGSEVCRFYGLAVTDVHFLRKPFTEEQLIERVKQVMTSSDPFPARIHRSPSAF